MEMFAQHLLLEGKTKIRQHYKYDCGAACLASVAAYYGVQFSLAHTRILCGCTPDGISLQGILDAASSLGFEANCYKSKEKHIHTLGEFTLPAIAHIKDHQGYLHFVVIYGISRKHVKVMDPAEGDMKKIPAEEFCNMWSGYIIRIVPSANLTSDTGAGGYREFLLALFRGNMKEILIALCGTIICICTAMATTLLLQQIIDVVIPKGDPGLVAVACPAVCLLMLLSLFIGYSATKYIIRSSIKIEYTMLAAYTGKLFRLPPSFFSSHSAGDISSRSDDIHLVRSFITTGIIGMVTGAFTIAAAVAVMVGYNIRLAAMVLCFIPAYWVLYRLSGRINRKLGKNLAKASADFESALLEGVDAAGVLRHYNAGEFATRRLESGYAVLSSALQKSAGAANLFETAVQGVSRMLVCLVLTVGTFYVFRGEITLGQLVGFYSLCSFFTVPLDDMTSSVNAMAKASVAGKRIYEILSLKGEGDGEEKISPKGIEGDIAVDSIKFRYPGREILFDGTSMVIEQGKITRIDAESGRGKSTLLKLIMGDYPLLEGTISYGGISISQFNPGEWRDMVAYVDQRPAILNTSILENITLGKEDPDMEKILGICRELKMEEMISRFPQGLLTNAGNGGMGLSGGECQKIGIARALYKDPKIYIFDEATSSMDHESEECAARCIHRLRECGKTIIAVSHKRDGAVIADNVVQLK